MGIDIEKEIETNFIDIGKRIKARRKQLGLTQEDLASKLNYDRSSIAKIETGINKLNYEKIQVFAHVLCTSPAYLIGLIDETTQHAFELHGAMVAMMQKLDIHHVESRTLPVLGTIACGEPIYAEEERVYITLEDAPKNADFILIAKGDSMINARIYDGDYVFIKKQSEVHNGEIAAVIIDNEATLKRVYFDKEQQTITLVAENPAYAPLVYSGERLEHIKVLGKAISFQSEVR